MGLEMDDPFYKLISGLLHGWKAGSCNYGMNNLTNVTRLKC